MKKESKSELEFKYRADLEIDIPCNSGPYLQPANRERWRSKVMFFLRLALDSTPINNGQKGDKDRDSANDHSERPLRNEVMVYEQSWR
jgi:hypothetical protein